MYLPTYCLFNLLGKKASSFLIVRSFSLREKVFLGVFVKGERQDFGAKCGALNYRCGRIGELMRIALMLLLEVRALTNKSAILREFIAGAFTGL
ncbi:hypothetical protein Tco_0322495 [Tanacetum coccineum]